MDGLFRRGRVKIAHFYPPAWHLIALFFFPPSLVNLRSLPPPCSDGLACVCAEVDLVPVTGCGWVAVGCWMSFTEWVFIEWALKAEGQKERGREDGKSRGLCGEAYSSFVCAETLLNLKSQGRGVKGGGQLMRADTDNNGDTDDKGLEQSGGRREEIRREEER